MKNNDIVIDESNARTLWLANVYNTFVTTLDINFDALPRTLKTTLGNKRPFVLDYIGSDRACYVQRQGLLMLEVFNDR